MGYATYNDYVQFFGDDSIPFERFSYEAERYIDNVTTGVDGVRKLKEFFPTDRDDIKAVVYAVCALAHAMYNIEKADENALSARGFTARADGVVVGNVVTSMSSGSESMSFSTGNTVNSALVNASTDTAARKAYYSDVVQRHLGGVRDANGVPLLYMGVYPRGR